MLRPTRVQEMFWPSRLAVTVWFLSKSLRSSHRTFFVLQHINFTSCLIHPPTGRCHGNHQFTCQWLPRDGWWVCICFIRRRKLLMIFPQCSLCNHVTDRRFLLVNKPPHHSQSFRYPWPPSPAHTQRQCHILYAYATSHQLSSFQKTSFNNLNLQSQITIQQNIWSL